MTSGRWLVATGLIAGAVSATITGCSQTGLSEAEIKDALHGAGRDGLPVTYHYRQERYSGDGAAVGGAATNGRATVKFEIVFGHPRIENPIFPQDTNDIDKFQRSANDAGYTMTFNLPPNRRQARLQAPLSNDIEGAICVQTDSCGGPAG